MMKTSSVICISGVLFCRWTKRIALSLRCRIPNESIIDDLPLSFCEHFIQQRHPLLVNYLESESSIEHILQQILI